MSLALMRLFRDRKQLDLINTSTEDGVHEPSAHEVISRPIFEYLHHQWHMQFVHEPSAHEVISRLRFFVSIGILG